MCFSGFFSLDSVFGSAVGFAGSFCSAAVFPDFSFSFCFASVLEIPGFGSAFGFARAGFSAPVGALSVTFLSMPAIFA